MEMFFMLLAGPCPKETILTHKYWVMDKWHVPRMKHSGKKLHVSSCYTFSGSQTALPHLHPVRYLCVSIYMNLLYGFARLIFQVNDRALGERLMSGMQRFSKLWKSFTIQLISLFPTLQKCKGQRQRAVIMQISQVCL